MPSGLERHVELTEKIIGACQEVHRVLGPGLEERFYRDAMMIELGLRGMKCRSEQEFAVEYKGRHIGAHRVDLIVEDKVLVELKAVSGQLSSLFVAQTISERRVTRLDVALLVNFGEISLQVRRLERRAEHGSI